MLIVRKAEQDRGAQDENQIGEDDGAQLEVFEGQRSDDEHRDACHDTDRQKSGGGQEFGPSIHILEPAGEDEEIDDPPHVRV